MRKFKGDRLSRVFPELQRKPHNQFKRELQILRNLVSQKQKLKRSQHL